MRWLSLGLLLFALTLGWVFVSRRADDALVVYCAHDLIFAQEVIDEFSARTGISVVVVGDTEATKSLGLVERLLAEKDHPRCDVFWNNQLLGTAELGRAGVLEAYKGPGYERIPARHKDADGLWTGFAGRLRVWIVNRDKMPATQEAVTNAFNGEDLSRFALAEPIFGTTLSHATIMWHKLGPQGFADWHESLQKRGSRFTPGNATVKNIVASGVCDFGWTDTDDYFVGKDDGFPVEMLPILVDGQSICIPNTVAIVRGTDQRERAQQLVDFLLSEEVELRLAKSAARQIPLGPVDASKIPADVKPLFEWAENSVPLPPLVEDRAACLSWLKREYAP